MVSAWNIFFAGIVGLFSLSSCSFLLNNYILYFCISQSWHWAVAGACMMMSNVMHYVLPTIWWWQFWDGPSGQFQVSLLAVQEG